MIDENDHQIGVITLKEALEAAWAKNLDLVQVTEKTVPPVVKITEYGKYLYALQKKDKSPKKTSEVKGIRLSYNISPHDMEMRATQAEKFLKKGDFLTKSSAWLFIIGVMLAFLLYYPLLAALPLPKADYSRLILLKSWI